MLPDFIESTGQYYHDFNKRIGSVRELYEECNLLIAKHPQSGENYLSPEVQLKTLETKYENRFAEFCRDLNLEPQIEKLYALTRIATPSAMPRQQDTQFYVYFCDNTENDPCVL